MKTCLAFALTFFGFTSQLLAQYADWKHSGSFYVLTTPDGADLPAGAVVTDFPLLVRLHKDFFDFGQAHAQGDDLRFSTPDGKPLAYQIEEWNPAKGEASIWVRVPRITGNSRQQLRIHWGKPEAKSESDGKAVFNKDNGFLSVWHLGETTTDEVGTLETKDVGTQPTPGVVGGARRLAGKQGLFGGEKITNYPTGAESHSTEAWIRAERSNATVIGWGNEGGGRGSKIRMQLRSPPHLHIDSDFSDVRGETRIPLGEWVHVAHTYVRGEGRIYINGKLDATAKPMLDIKRPSRLWIGGWYHNYDFIGEIDEVRISQVTRSPEWIRLSYENQKPMQTLVGPIVRPGNELNLGKERIEIGEGSTHTFTAKADGALKLIWSLQRDGKWTTLAVDRWNLPWAAGRVVGDQVVTVQLKAVYPEEVRTKQVVVTIKEAIPEPSFELKAPATWNGRDPIEVVPVVTNEKALAAAGAGELQLNWQTEGIASIREPGKNKLVLRRSLNSGKLTVVLSLSNGGQAISKSATITVTEPARDPWVERSPDKEEMPQDHQFYARDDQGEGTIFCTGKLKEPVEQVFLRLYADDKLTTTKKEKPKAGGDYSMSVRLKAGLVKYRVEFGAVQGDREVVLHKAEDLVCGDAFIIQGQSNAVATDFGKEDPAFRSEWIRSFGSMSGNPKGIAAWGTAVHRSRDAEKFQIGYWGMELGRRLVEEHKIPVCIINGAVGGTRIDQHQRNSANPEDTTTIYGRLLWRVRQARLTHGIRGIFWHQGENDQGADGPTGGYGWETYRQYFHDLAAAWKSDFPNVQSMYLFQIWPKACAMGIQGSDNRLREVQRNLPGGFSNLRIMSTLGINPPGGCHFPAAGYAEFARLIQPLVEKDHYRKSFADSITPPNLLQARYSDETRQEIVLEFDQPVKWEDTLLDQFHLDGVKGKLASARAQQNQLRLKLTAPSEAKTITYLDSANWNPARVLRGANGIAALTFCEVPIGKK